MSKNGLILLKPTSIAYTGTSASITAKGSVGFNSCTSLSLNGVFDENYENYMLCLWWEQSTTNTTLAARLRANGVDSTSTADYNDQTLILSSTSILAYKYTNQGAWQFSMYSSTGRTNGLVSYFYGPSLAQPTAFATTNVDCIANSALIDTSGTHEQSSSYDGITLYSYAFSGRVAVYGMRK